MNCMYRNGDSSKRDVGSTTISGVEASGAGEVERGHGASNPAPPAAISPSEWRRETLCLVGTLRGERRSLAPAAAPPEASAAVVVAGRRSRRLRLVVGLRGRGLEVLAEEERHDAVAVLVLGHAPRDRRELREVLEGQVLPF